MIFWIIAVILVIVAACRTIVLERRNKILKDNMSFIESLKLTGLPVVSLENNGHWVNMLLDTGSTHSIINSKILDGLEYTMVEGNSNVYGLNGESQKGGIAVLPLGYKENVYEVRCLSVDMEQTFSKMKSQFGVTVHGVLGTDFFDKYSYILDFKDMIAYSKGIKS